MVSTNPSLNIPSSNAASQLHSTHWPNATCSGPRNCRGRGAHPLARYKFTIPSRLFEEGLYEMLKQLIENPIFSLVNLLIGLLGLTIAIIFYYKQKKVKRINYVCRTTNLLCDTNKWGKLRVSYSRKRIKCLSTSFIAFWNSGTETISREDIAIAAPLRILLDEKDELLEAEIIKCNNHANCISLSITQTNQLIVSFDYLDKTDGAILRIIHTGKEYPTPVMIGEIKGGKCYWLAKGRYFIENLKVYLPMLLVGSISIPLGIFGIQWGSWELLLMAAMGFLGGFVSLYVLFDRNSTVPIRLMPGPPS